MIKLTSKSLKGAVLSLVTLMVAILMIAGVALLKIGINARITSVYASSEMSARAAADAGLSHALTLMNQKIEDEYIWDADTLPACPDTPLPNCQATYSFQISGNVDDGYKVISTGKTNLTEKTVISTLKLKGLFDYAIFADDTMEFKMGTTVDVLNKGPGDETLLLATNSIEEEALGLKADVTVDGDVICGPDGDPDVVIACKLDANITGDTYSLPQEWDFPQIIVPEPLASAPSKGTLNGGEVITDDGKYDTINVLGANNTITIDGDVILYILGDVSIGNTCTIEIVDIITKPDAALTLFLGGNYFQKNDAHFINRTKDPSRLKIYGLEGCTEITFLTDSVLYASIYAPYAEMLLHNSVEITGSVVVSDYIQNVAADFHYDPSLTNVSMDDIGVQFTVNRWQE